MEMRRGGNELSRAHRPNPYLLIIMLIRFTLDVSSGGASFCSYSAIKVSKRLPLKAFRLED